MPRARAARRAAQRRRRMSHPLHVAAQGAGGRRRAQPAIADRRHRQSGRRPQRRRFTCPPWPIRTGDTPAAERARFQREPADILITTPESLYLLLTSNAREALRSVDTVIIDEIHALVPTKRGAHLALSLERLESLTATPAQRIGLSATQRPLDEVARFLGGAQHGTTPIDDGSGTKARPPIADPEDAIHDEFTSDRTTPTYRPVTIVDTSQKKQLELRDRGAGRGHGQDRRGRGDPQRSGVAGDGAHVDLERHPSAAARARAGASIHADLRQQPPHRRAAGVGAQRDCRRAAGRARTMDRSRARSGSRSRTC